MKKVYFKKIFFAIVLFCNLNVFSQTITLTSSVSTTVQTLCVNSSLIEIKYTATGAVSDAIISGLPSGVYGVYSSGVFTINGTPTQTGNFVYTITTIGGVNPATAVGYINVDGVATANEGATYDVCNNSSITLTDIGVSTGNYMWTHNGLGSLSNVTTLSPTYVAIAGDAGGSVDLVLTVTSNNMCATTTATATYTLNITTAPSVSGSLLTYVGSTVQLAGSATQHQYYPWSSSDASVASIDNTGLVTGVALGSTTIGYKNDQNCDFYKIFNVVTLVTPTITGATTICVGSITQLSGSETPMSATAWTSSIPSIATVNSSGLVTSILPGVTTITYTNSTGGTATTTVVINVSPIVTVNSVSICMSGAAVLTATAVNTGGSFLWDTYLTTSSITVTPTSTTNYSVTYTLNGCTSTTAFGTVTVNPNPTINAGSDQTICSGDMVTLTATGGSTYSWDNGITNATGFTPTVGTTNYSVTGTDANGCVGTDQVMVTVNANSSLTSQSTVSQTVCQGNSFSPISISGLGLGLTYQWYSNTASSNVGGAIITGATAPSYSPLSSTSGTIYYYAEISGLCGPSITSSVSGAMIVDPIPTVTVNSPSICTGTAATLTATPSITGGTFIWNDASTNSTLTVTPSATTTYSVIYTSLNGCQSNSENGTVTANPLNTISLISIVGSDNQSIIVDSPIADINYSTSGATGATITGLPSGVIGNWNSDMVIVSGTPSVSGTFTYMITSTDGCGTVTSSGVIIVSPLPVNLIITDPAAVCSTQTIDITSPSITFGSTVGGTFSYWTDALATSTLVNPATISTSGVYYIKSDIGVNSAIKPVTVTINPSPVLIIANPAPVTAPNKVDITTSAVTAGSTFIGSLTYWINPDASIPMATPSTISMSGTYFIKTTFGSCTTIGFVTATIVAPVVSTTSNLNAYVVPEDVTVAGACDGEAKVIITEGKAPYTYLYSDNTSSSITQNLCAGLKSVRVTDANNDTLFLDFLISSLANSTTTTNLSDSVIVDSVFSTVVTNCTLDYTAVSSASILNYSFISNDSISVAWTILSGGTSVTIVENYYVRINSGVLLVALQVYCPNKANGNFLTAYDQLYIIQGAGNSTGLTKSDFNKMKVYPNPFEDQLIISLEEKTSSEITLTDVSGKIIQQIKADQSAVILDTRLLEKGVYCVTIKTNSSTMTKQIVK